MTPRSPIHLRSRAFACALLAASGVFGGVFGVVFGGCGRNRNDSQAPDAGAQAPATCVSAADADGDCIANGTEGCLLSPPADRDGDGLSNHRDTDADGDGIPDEIEVGPDCDIPRDTDGDSLTDYLDEDTDNDGVSDRYEDRDGDGRIGACATACAASEQCDLAAGERCSVALDQSGGTCVSLACMGGESDPRSKDTDGDGTPDATEGTFICNPPGPDNPFGLAAVGYADARDTRYPDANWRIAFELGAAHGEVVIDAPVALESAHVVNLGDQVSGFLVTRPAPAGVGPSAAAAADAAARALAEAPEILDVITRSSGVSAQVPGGFDAIVRTTLVATTTAPTTAPAVRSAAIAALLGRAPGTVTVPAPMPPPPDDGGEEPETDTAFAITYQTVQRGAGAGAQSLFLGAVTPLGIHDDPARGAALRADDLSNGSALAASGAAEATECVRGRAAEARTVDMLWVVDEAEATEEARARLSALADRMLARAQASGRDVRMGVTDMRGIAAGGEPGRFASRAAGGTGDRWLTADDADDLAAGLRDPSGPDSADDAHHGLTQAGAAIARHLPRAADDAQRIRPGAALVLIYVSGEKPQEIEDQTTLGDGDTRPSLLQEGQIAAVLAPYLAVLAEQGAQAYLIAEPLPFDSPRCAGAREHAYGYYRLVEATGGLVGSICQDDLGPTVELVLDAVAARVSPLSLPHRPISASLAVTRDDVLVPRSRAIGWSYGAAADTIVLLGQPSEPAGPGDVVIAYRRWVLP
jgi:hypothetical protein